MTPELIDTVRDYSRAALLRDALAGLTVAMVAIPLSLAIAIASGADPATGLVTAIVAGFLISALGGSKVQIGGPTGAFIVVVYGVIARHGFDGLVTTGTASFKPGRYDGGGMRYLRFTNWLTELDRLSGPVGTIWFEEVRRHAGTDAAHVYGGLMASLTSWAELRGIPYEGVPVGTIKRHATGKGNANKAAMIAAAKARGFSPADDNEADAIAILHWAIETRGGVA